MSIDKDTQNIVSALDVARYIIESNGSISRLFLHQLLYYSQAWSLVWDNQPLFHERIEAWIFNPVISNMWYSHDSYTVSLKSNLGDSSKLKDFQKETINKVVYYYSRLYPQELGDLIRSEDPWKNARIGISPDRRGNVEITHKSIKDYYSKLTKYNTGYLDYDSLIKEVEGLESAGNLDRDCIDSLKSIPNTQTVSITLPTKMVKLLQIHAERENLDLDFLIKKWVDESLRSYKMNNENKFTPTDNRITIEFDNHLMAKHFKIWLCESGEQDYWLWMVEQSEEEDVPIKADSFDYLKDPNKIIGKVYKEEE